MDHQRMIAILTPVSRKLRVVSDRLTKRSPSVILMQKSGVWGGKSFAEYDKYFVLPGQPWIQGRNDIKL